MTRERWEQILFAHVDDEMVQDMLNEYVLEIEAENVKLRDLVNGILICDSEDADAEVQCPLYDKSEPYRCKKERLIAELKLDADRE